MRRSDFDNLEADFQQYYNLDVSEVPTRRAARLMSKLPRGARVFREVSPATEWGWQEIYLANAVDALNILVWQNSKAGKNNSKRPESVIPKEIKREFEKAARKRDAKNGGYEAMDIDDIKKILSKPRS